MRNIVWHGFLESVDYHYVTFLFVIIISYGKLLRNETILPRLRPEITFEICFNDETFCFDNLLKSPTIQQLNSTAWKIILNLHKTGNSKSAIFQLLPQIECLLRFIYGQINQVDVTAHLDKYYIIMDSIFYEFILEEDFTPLVIGKINKAHELEIRSKNKRNKILEVFPTSLMLLGFDIFHAADGPRIRDKISHGEAVCDVNSGRIVRKLLQFVSHVVGFHDDGISPIFDYESVYMNSFKVARTYNNLVEEIEKVFESLEIPESLKFENLEFKLNLEKIEMKKVKAFFRPFNESQTMKLLLKILEITYKAAANFSFSCDEFFQQFNARKLRSTRRETLKQIIVDLPNLFKGFREILKLVYDTFVTSQQVDNEGVRYKIPFTFAIGTFAPFYLPLIFLPLGTFAPSFVFHWYFCPSNNLTHRTFYLFSFYIQFISPSYKFPTKHLPLVLLPQN